MVSFWPFGGEGRSAAEFEKILAALSEKINRTSAKDAKLRSTQRRLEGLWMLYTGSAYFVALLVLFFVVGRSNWTTLEIAGVVGGPVIIYTVRLAIDAFYEYRISGTQLRLSELTKQRNEAIEKLKAATKYNSTQQLLDKYGGSSPKEKPDGKGGRSVKASGGKAADTRRQSLQRTGIPPPPTANIQNRSPTSTTTHSRQVSQQDPQQQQQQPPFSPTSDTTAEFAPNAFWPLSPNSPLDPNASYPRSTAQFPPPEPHSPALRTRPSTDSLGAGAGTGAGASSKRASRSWTDRLMDVILGEDETQPRNRLALLCRNPECGLVNGLAPPGTRSLDDVGRWRCMACGAWNGTAPANAAKGATGGIAGHTPSASVTSFGSVEPSSAVSPVEAHGSAKETSVVERNKGVDDDDDGVGTDDEIEVEGHEAVGSAAPNAKDDPGKGSVRQRKK